MNHTEKLEILTGDRGDRKNMAVRVGDLDELLRRANKLTATKVTAAPTAAQYNALLDDVQSIVNSFTVIAKQLQGKIIR